MRDCSPARLRRLIHSAGCQSIKARRLKAVATFIDDSGGLNKLAKQPTETLRKALLKVHGIGPETADAMLGFAFKRRVFIADQYARRWLWRMGLAPDEIQHDYDGGRRLGEKLLQRSVIDRQDVHAAIVLHGQAVCKRVPDCPRCFIRRQCKEGSKENLWCRT